MRVNSFQEIQDQEKIQPKLKKSIQAHNKLEKGKTYAKDTTFIKPKYILTIPCPKCKSNNITAKNGINTCVSCKETYQVDHLFKLKNDEQNNNK